MRDCEGIAPQFTVAPISTRGLYAVSVTVTTVVTAASAEDAKQLALADLAVAGVSEKLLTEMARPESSRAVEAA